MYSAISSLSYTFKFEHSFTGEYYDIGKRRQIFWKCPRMRANSRQWHLDVGRTKTCPERNHFLVLAANRKRQNLRVSTFLKIIVKKLSTTTQFFFKWPNQGFQIRVSILIPYVQCCKLSFLGIHVRALFPKRILRYQKKKATLKNFP